MIRTFLSEIDNFIKNHAKQYKNIRILDLGCGTGEYTHYYGFHNKTVGIDLQNVVQKCFNNFKFLKDDATNLSFPDNTFDLIVSFDVIEHVKQDKKMLKEIYRVLKINGQLLLGTPNKNRLSNILFKLIGKPRTYPLFLGHDQFLGDMIHVKEYTPEELYNIAKSVGLTNISITHLWLGLTVSPGLVKIPNILKPFCQYLFIHASK